MDFLNYWDTRIDANERFFNDYPHIANFAFSECQELWDHMSADYAALLARHTALVEAVKWMLYIDTPENFEGKSHIEARANVEKLLEEK